MSDAQNRSSFVFRNCCDKLRDEILLLKNILFSSISFFIFHILLFFPSLQEMFKYLTKNVQNIEPFLCGKLIRSN